MSIQEYEKLSKLVKQALIELDGQLTSQELLSDQYDGAVLEVKKKVIENAGFDFQKYLDLEKQVKGLSKAKLKAFMEKTGQDIGTTQQQISNLYIPTESDIASIAEQVAKKYVVPPQITNQIIKETIVEKPITQIINQIDQTKIEELRQELIDLQTYNLDNYDEIRKLREANQSLLPKDFKEKWDLLTTGQLADALHKHDIRQRRGYGGVDRETVLKLISENIGETSIGGTIVGGTLGSVLFINPANVIAQDNTNFFYNSTYHQLRVGLSGAPFDNDARVRLQVVGNINDYADAAAQNQNSGDSATTDFFTSADNDSTTLIGHYTDFGITSSGWNPSTAGNIKTVSINAAGSGYSVGNVLTISTGGDGNGTVTVATVNGSGGVTSVTILSNGTGYVTGSGYSTTGGAGSGCLINVLALIDFTMWGANDGYLFNSGGNLIISTDTLNKVIKFSVGGIGTINEVGRFTSSGLTVGLTGTLTGAIKFAGGTSTQITLQGQAVGASGVLTLPAVTGTVISTGNLTSITATGTIASGTWNGSVIGATYGGTGINNGSNTLTINTNPGTIAFGTASATITFQGTDTYVGRATTDTLTNKRITKRISTVADATSISVNADSFDEVNQTNTQSAGTLTLNNPTGTPNNGDKLEYIVKCTNVQTLAFGTSFAFSTDLPAPSATTGSSKIDYLGFEYSTINSKWNLLAKVQGFT